MILKQKQQLMFTFLGIGIVVLFLLDLVLGSVLIPVSELWGYLMGREPDSVRSLILFDFRLPKAILAVFTGASLSVAGLMMQTLFRNPLAGPYVLGISSGAMLGVALLVMVFGIGGLGLGLNAVLGNLGLIGASILGSVGVMLLVILVSVRVRDSVSILIIGIMFGSITGAIVSVIQYFSDPDSVHSFLVWTFGSVSDITWNQLYFLIPILLIGLLIALSLQKPLNALLIGENYARGIGVDVKQIRFYIIVLTSLLAGGLTAFTGPIAFIGVAVPHIARGLFKSADHRILVPAALLIGAGLMLLCDMISQLPGSNQVLPINSVTALFGAPVVIWVIARKRK